ncbi:hypothetical protein V5N11_000293 [Cardamine amara subsp. amara]|uniref:Uncharacterized protein n=1 Tax=Cardamine amara subsp. amara TaxID=228776 RepID=A0ABD1B7Y1_CARAN
MVDNSNNKKRKEFISEEDIATLLQRYDTMTILKLLQEMAYYAESKMDWNELVKKTTTGITNAREYQLLWRHLAYRDSLLPVEDNAQVLDDDSDMECELEASPAVSVDTITEAVAHVKVMAASYLPSDSDIPEDSTVEAPLTINIPYGLQRGTQEPSDSFWSSRGMNITFPISLQKAAEGHNVNGPASNMAPRKRRKKWSAEEDEELIAAVKQHGEGSWARIAREEFDGERTASQLSQRWGAMKRRSDTPNTSTQSGLQRTEAQMAANRALSLAVGTRVPSKKPAVGIPPVLSSGNTTGTQAKGANNGSSLQGQQQSQPVLQALPQAAASASTAKSRVPAKKTTGNSSSRAQLMVTANSAAAAACMSGLATAALVPKVEPGKNVVSALVPKAEPVKTASTATLPRPSGSAALKAEPVKTAPVAASFPRPSGIISAPKAAPVKPASPASLPYPSSIISAPKAEPVKTALTAASFPRPPGIILAPQAEPVKTVTAGVALPRPSSIQSAPKAEPVKSFAAPGTNTRAVGPLSLRPTVNGSPNHAISSSPSNKPSPVPPLYKGSTIPNNSVPSSFASSRLAPTQRSTTATVIPQKPTVEVAVTASSKPVSVQKEQTQGNKTSPLVTTTTLQPNKTITTNSVISTGKPVAAKVENPTTLMPKKNQEVVSSNDNSSLEKPPGKESSTTVPPPVVAAAESKPKDEAIKSQDVATVTGTEQKKL